MATQNVNCFGYSTLELLVSSAIGVIVLSIVSNLFFTSQSLSSYRTQQLTLEQKVSALLMQIKQDIQRAGYDGTDSTRTFLSGATLPLVTTSDSLAYAYRIDIDSDEAFQNIAYYYDTETSSSNRIKYCEKTSAEPLSFEQATTSGVGGFCYSVFDSNYINVDEFVVSSELIASSAFSSQLHTITLEASLVELSDISVSSSISLLQRN
ncbi:PilW family protein [Vibrio marisflavi]|uniref:Pilus assembly protein PilW n=1 Tax=Vibrio marisflavi CECT 7928 TaxID=634439 RepID=A0ABN8E486_9VIBR|nr:hypothetical protein [Vibrio marisflavi]CAH0538868.1 hypothetical protein VMF7928_01728 [Vibrio marisflavi CECT 7928]